MIQKNVDKAINSKLSETNIEKHLKTMYDKQALADKNTFLKYASTMNESIEEMSEELDNYTINHDKAIKRYTDNKKRISNFNALTESILDLTKSISLIMVVSMMFMFLTIFLYNTFDLKIWKTALMLLTIPLAGLTIYWILQGADTLKWQIKRIRR